MDGLVFHADSIETSAIKEDEEYEGVRVLLQSTLARAISATFERRRTPVPHGTPTGLSDEFARDPSRIRQWSAFHNRLGIAELMSLEQVVGKIRSKLAPILETIARESDPSRSPPEKKIP